MDYMHDQERLRISSAPAKLEGGALEGSIGLHLLGKYLKCRPSDPTFQQHLHKGTS